MDPISNFKALYPGFKASGSLTQLMVDDDNISVSEDDASDFEKQKSSLETYLKSLPYDCESVEEMHAKLEEIVGKMVVCAKSKNWLRLISWDSMLQFWLLMRYPIQKTTRAKLTRFYYELCLLPGIEPRVIRSWADTLSRLASNKSNGSRMLEASDLQLPWKPLWEALRKEAFPKKRVQDSSRNVVNLLLFVAEICRRYFPVSDIPEMLETFVPITTQDNILTMIHVYAAFLPPTQTKLYLPMLCKLGQAFNSSIVDERLLDLAGQLSEEHVASSSESDGAEWNDVGIWSQEQWTILMGKIISSLSVPVGNAKVSPTTAAHADKGTYPPPSRIDKSINRLIGISKLLVYSLAPDSPNRSDSLPNNTQANEQQAGYVGGSKALDSLEKIVTSTESYFHPSNSGIWTPILTSLLQRLASEFGKRCQEELQPGCKTPEDRRVTPLIRKSFVKILRTPAYLAMFSKDPISMGFAQNALKTMALLEPQLVMPELLDRAVGGLEVINETHRTTAVLSMLSGIARPLVSENVWLTGQRHLVPLLEMCIPGIDLNDPIKTLCATAFITSVVINIRIGDLSNEPSKLPSGDSDTESAMDVDESGLNDGSFDVPKLSKEDERSLARDSTVGFADWVTSLFRRVISLYENLPEEGGKRNTTGGKQEEAVLQSVRSMVDAVCVSLSDELFDLILNLVFEYATTNAKSNAVKAFSQIVSCLTNAHPDRTQAKFLPHCFATIAEELHNGASSVRTTSSHAAVPSDTTLHWNMSILRGCFGYSGVTILKYKKEIVGVVNTLINLTKSERGYSGTGQIITRLLQAVSSVYTIKQRFVNDDEWDSPDFKRDHIRSWGRLYEPDEVIYNWHVPSTEEITFVIEILDEVVSPALDKVESLLTHTESWDNVSRNDFCRNLNACRAIWAGLPGFIKERQKGVGNPCLENDIEIEDLIVSTLDVKAGFILTEPTDPRYQKVEQHRTRFGEVVRRAAAALRSTTSEDHIDAVILVGKAIDTYLLGYAMDRVLFESLRKNYVGMRDLSRFWPKQRENGRIIFTKRAYVYHGNRLLMHSLFRRRSALDDKLILELVESSLSPYTRVRRHAQTILLAVLTCFVRSEKIVLPKVFDALTKGTDADRMKGALYVLLSKGTLQYTLSDPNYHVQVLVSLLECQHEDKPSVQQVVSTLVQDCLTFLPEEQVNTECGAFESSRLDDAISDITLEFSPRLLDKGLLEDAVCKRETLIVRRVAAYNKTVAKVLQIAAGKNTHWRYVQMADMILFKLLHRDRAVPPEVAKVFMDHTKSPQPTIRDNAEVSIVTILAHAKMRAYSKTPEELWQGGWHNPLEQQVTIADPDQFVASLQAPIDSAKEGFFVDGLATGFLAWSSKIKAVRPAWDSPPPASDRSSLPTLEVIRTTLVDSEYFKSLSALWSQESNKSTGFANPRPNHLGFIKSLAKSFGPRETIKLLEIIDPLVTDSDKYKQRAGAEILGGLLRGSKHWPKPSQDDLWKWTVERLDRVLAQAKPDTLPLWGIVLASQLVEWDPRRNQPLLDWILSLSFDFNGESAFETTKSLTMLGLLVHALGTRFNNQADKYVNIFFENANTSYAEVRMHISQWLDGVMKNQWQPVYPSVDSFLDACQNSSDPFKICEARHLIVVDNILAKFPKWREERLPPPRVNQSEYDKVGLTLLRWIWVVAHGSRASSMFPYVTPMMSEVFRMSELNDNPELQSYSSAVLYVLSAVQPSPKYVEVVLDNFLDSIKLSDSWRIRRHALPALVVFTFRNLLVVPPLIISKIMDVLVECLSDENVEVREIASNALSGIIRCSQRQSIVPLKNRFVRSIRRIKLPSRNDPTYSNLLRQLHSAILGLCALISSFPYSVEPWMPPLTEILAPHATDPPPISNTIRKSASEFKKTHQDTWHKDQHMFDENQLQSLSTMLVGTSYYA